MRSEDKIFDELSNKLYILGEPIRMQIMRVICRSGSLRAVDILEEFSISQPTLSHHMNLLLEADLVTTRKDGRSIWYSVNNDTISELISFVGELNAKPGVSTVAPRKPIRNVSVARKTKAAEKPALKNDSSVPKPKNKIEAPDIEELKKKKEKKKKKDDKKKKDKDKDKKKKK